MEKETFELTFEKDRKSLIAFLRAGGLTGPSKPAPDFSRKVMKRIRRSRMEAAQKYDDDSRSSIYRTFADSQQDVAKGDKQLIAQWAVNQLPQLKAVGGAGIVLDAGSSTLEAWLAVRKRIVNNELPHVTVSTNSFSVLQDYVTQNIALGTTKIELIGTSFDAEHRAFYGEEQIPAGFRPNVVYIGIAGFEINESEILIGYHAGLPELKAKSFLFECQAKARVLLVTPHKIGLTGGRVLDVLSIDKLKTSAPIYLVTVEPDPMIPEQEEQFVKTLENFRKPGLLEKLDSKGIEFHWVTLSRTSTLEDISVKDHLNSKDLAPSKKVVSIHQQHAS